MRILHTSDWHLGRSFHGMSLHDLSAEILAELLETVEQEKIDVVLVSGDVYDQAQPRTETVALLSATLEKLSAAGVTVVATSGNHDSAPRLGFGAQLMKAAGIHLLTNPAQLAEPVLVERAGQQVAFYGIPYLEPRAVAASLNVEPSHSAVLTAAMSQIVADIETRRPTASVVLAHCFAHGGTESDSERDIRAGGVHTVSADIFAGADYVALGHLHGRQKIRERVRYSGSLLPFSFSEEKHRKGAWIIEIHDDGRLGITEHNWRTRLPLVTLRGELAELLEDPALEVHRQSVCRIYLTDARRPAAAIERLRERFETVAELFFAPATSAEVPQESYAQKMGQKKPLGQISKEFFTHVREREPDAVEAEYLDSVAQKALENVRLREQKI